MVQVKATLKTSGDGAHYSDFNVIWPPAFTGTILFDASKNYSASAKPGGKICFKIK